MSKRSFPFNSCSPLQLKTHVGSKQMNNNEEAMQKVYAKTQSILKAGAKAQSQKTQVDEDTAQNGNICAYCRKTATQLAKCSFCEKQVCIYCFNVCFNCEQNFCPLCSIISYDDRMEKSYCLSCNGS